MPKVKYYKPPSRTLKLQTKIENALNEAENYSGMSRPELLHAMKTSPSTLWRRIQSPEEFTLKELRTIALLSGRSFPEFLSELVQ